MIENFWWQPPLGEKRCAMPREMEQMIWKGNDRNDSRSLLIHYLLDYLAGDVNSIKIIR